MRSHLKSLIWIALAACLSWGLCANPVSAADDPAAAGHPAGADAGHGAGGVNFDDPPLIPDPVMVVFTLVLFGAFVLGMRVAVWKPLIAGLDAREARIVKAENDARAAKLEVEKLAALAERRMSEAHNQVHQILAQARVEAEAKKQEIVSQAEQDAQRIKREALEAIASARDAALRELDATVDRQAALATEHIAGRRI